MDVICPYCSKTCTVDGSKNNTLYITAVIVGAAVFVIMAGMLLYEPGPPEPPPHPLDACTKTMNMYDRSASTKGPEIQHIFEYCETLVKELGYK